MEEKRLTPLKAIRAKCLDCCCQQANEVRLCTVKGCPLYDYRMGKNPNRKGVGRRDFGNAIRMEKSAIE
jgi:hypothetical protein